MQRKRNADVSAGDRFDRLVVGGEAGRMGGQRMVHATCDCGAEKVVRVSHLLRGQIRSCGCIRSVSSGHARRTQGRTSTYDSWRGMIGRCFYESTAGWENYGGRGITACERWRTFANFLADMGERPKDTTIDRIDNDGNYEPGNCRWATKAQQVSNTRKRPSSR